MWINKVTERRRHNLSVSRITWLQDQILSRNFYLVIGVWLTVYFFVGVLFWIIYSVDPSLLMKGNIAADWKDALSFSFVTQATVGYGDVTPQGALRIAANIQAVVGTGLNGAALGILTFRILKRNNPIKMPDTVSFSKTKSGDFVFWFRYISVDTDMLMDGTVRLYFSTDASITHPLYDALGGKIREMRLPVIEPMVVMALYIKAEKKPFDLHSSDSAAQANDDVVPLHPNMFTHEGLIDPHAKLWLTIQAFHSSTGEAFYVHKKYYARDIVCAPFDNINNVEFINLDTESRRKKIAEKFGRHVSSTEERCLSCQELQICPFARPLKT